MIYVLIVIISSIFFIYPIFLLLMVMISIDVDTSFDFQTTYVELLSLEGESFWSLGKSMPTPRTEIAV